MAGSLAGLAPITVLGNVAVDRVDGGPPRPGGCPVFAAPVVGPAGGSVVTRCAPADRPLFEPAFAGCRATILDAGETAGFEIVNDGDGRSMTVTRTGDRWRPDDVEGLALEEWVHVGALLRDEVGADVLARLEGLGHRIAFDGQGLVRARAVGPLRTEARADQALLRHVAVLKLSDVEADAIAHPFGAAEAAAFGIPEVVVTHGSRGVVVHCGGDARHVEPPRRVGAADATGSGDTFMAAYVGARAAGEGPVEAARVAVRVVVEMLERRAS